MLVRNKIKGLRIYLTQGYQVLSNWPAFYFDLLRSIFKLKNQNYIYMLRDGTKIKVHPQSTALNHVFYTVYLKNEYDGRENFHINSNDIIIDVGAHLGFFSIKASKIARYGIVYAFEPFSKHYNLLRENIQSNGIMNIKFYNLAISDKSGDLSFFYTMYGDPGDTSLFKIHPDKKLYEEKIKSITLDDFFQQENLERCDFLKMDCEGAEYSILLNTSISTLNKISKIAMEWHKFTDDQDPKLLTKFLKASGFRVIEPIHYKDTAGFLFAYK